MKRRTRTQKQALLPHFEDDPESSVCSGTIDGESPSPDSMEAFSKQTILPIVNKGSRLQQAAPGPVWFKSWAFSYYGKPVSSRDENFFGMFKLLLLHEQ